MANDTQIVFTARDDTRGAIESVARGLGSIRESAQNVEGAVGHLEGLFGKVFAGFSVAALVSGVHDAIESMAALDDAAERTGASVEKLSALKGVAKLGDVSFDQVEQGLIRFAKVLAGADDEAKAAGRAFATLELDPEKLRLMDTADAFKAFSDRLAEFKDGPGKTALVQDLGKGMAGLLPFMKDLAAAGDLVGKVTDEQAAQAEQFDKNMKRLQGTFSGAAKTVAGEVLPMLVELTGGMKDASGAAKDANNSFAHLLASGARTALETIAVLGINVAYVFKGIGTEIGGIAAQLAALGRGDLKGAKAIGDAMKADAEQARKEVDERSARILNAGNRPADADNRPGIDYKTSSPKNGSEPKGPKFDPEVFHLDVVAENAKAAQKELEALAKAQEEYGKHVDALVGPLEAQAATLERQVATYGQSEAAVQRDTVARLEEARAIAAERGAWEDHLAVLDREIEARKRLAQASESMQIKRMLDATPSGQMEKSRADMQLLAKALQDGRLNEGEYLEAVQARLKTLPEDLNKAKSAAEELGITFSSAFEEAMVGGKSFKDILSGLEKDLLRIFTRKLVTEPLAEVATNFFKPEGEQSHKALDASGDFMASLKKGAKSLWDSFFGTSDAAKGLTKAATDSAAKVAESAVENAAATTSLSSLAAAATQASAALTAMAGSSTAKDAGGFLMAIFGGKPLTGGTQMAPYAPEAAVTMTAADGGVMGTFGPMPLSRFAAGGIAKSPQFALFGEAGPEAFVPLPDGRSIPVNLNNAGARQTVVNMQVVTPDTNSFRASKGQIVAEMSRAMAAGQRYL